MNKLEKILLKFKGNTKKFDKFIKKEILKLNNKK